MAIDLLTVPNILDFNADLKLQGFKVYPIDTRKNLVRSYNRKDFYKIQREFYDFYRTPRGEYTPKGGSREFTTHPTLASNAKFMNFYPFNDIETISPRPMLFITGDKAHSKEFSEDAYKRAAEPKELHYIANAGHVDLYDNVELIPFEKLESFFTKNLGTLPKTKS